jgi:CRP-like cAMP-binding protein
VDPEILKKAPLFAGLEDEAATALSSAMGKLHLNKGDVLFHEGDLEDRLYIVVSGKIKLGRSGSAGRENLLAVLGPGQMFGELSVFDPDRDQPPPRLLRRVSCGRSSTMS